MDISNLLKTLKTEQKRMVIASAVTFCVTYVFLIRFIGKGFLDFDIYTRASYSVSLTAFCMIVNYCAIIISRLISGVVIEFRYTQLLVPQVSALMAAYYDTRDIALYASVAYASALFFIILVPILFSFFDSDSDTRKNQDKLEHKQKRPKRKRRK